MSEVRRYRRWHPTHGAGYCVYKTGEFDGKFEADSGFIVPMSNIIQMGTGKPGKRLPMNRAHEDWQWQWLKSSAGEVFVFRDAPPNGWPVVEVTT